MTKEKKYMIIGIFILMITLIGGVGTYAGLHGKVLVIHHLQ